MSNQIFENNDVNGAGTPCKGPLPCSCSSLHLRGSVKVLYPAGAPHQTCGDVKWNKKFNKIVMGFFYRSKPFDEEEKTYRGYRKRMFREWRERREWRECLENGEKGENGENV